MRIVPAIEQRGLLHMYLMILHVHLMIEAPGIARGKIKDL